MEYVSNNLTYYNSTITNCFNKSKKWYKLTVVPNLQDLEKLKIKNMHPGYYLKLHRSITNQTLPEIAKQINVYHHTLEAIELLNNYPTNDISIKLSNHFNLDTKYFYDTYLEELEELDTKLLNYIKANNMNILQFSKYIEVDRRTISSWIKKKNKPSRQSYIKLKEKNII